MMKPICSRHPFSLRASAYLFPGAAMVALIVAAQGCAIARPFEGPGYDPGRGVTAGPEVQEAVVMLTWARLDGDKRDAFDDHIDIIMERIDTQPGLIGSSFRIEILGDEVWTMSAWENAEALRRFVKSELHLDAMVAGAPAVVDMKFSQLTVPRRDIPISWDRALETLAAQSQRYSHGGPR